jgi:hypothetical protein
MQAQLDDETFNFFSKLITMRNSATHNFSADFNAIKNFIELFICYLSSNILDKPSDEFIKHENVLSEPVMGEWYISVIDSKHHEYPTYYLKNPNLLLPNNRPKILLNLNYNSHLNSEVLNIGDKIRFQLKIVESRDGLNYYANSAKKLE